MKIKNTFILLMVLTVITGSFLTTDTFAQFTQEWLHRYTGPEASSDTPNDFVYDSEGNIYITGHTLLGGAFNKMVTVKFNPQGIRLWVTKYPAPANTIVSGTSLKVDQSGNVYVCGQIKNTGGNYNLLTVKYNTVGVMQWDNVYNGPGNFDDYGIGSVIDQDGYFYSAGHSYGSGTDYDFVVLKFDFNGSVLWTRRWNGIQNREDYLKRIALSGDGGVVISGSSNTASGFDFATVKYNSSGTLLWEKIYNGPASNIDMMNDMITDASGNVFVCGYSLGVGSNNDATLLKYDAAGVQQWVSRYNGPSNHEDNAVALDLDNNGNIFVTGFTLTNGAFYDFLTIKYNSAGSQQWARIHDGADHFFDKANSIKADLIGNSYITGFESKLDGTVDCAVIKYDANGNKQWQKMYDGPGGLDDMPVKLMLENKTLPTVLLSSYSYYFSPPPGINALDLITAKMNDPAPEILSELCGANDYLILKYDPSSELILEQRYDGSGTGNDEASAICVDAQQNAYVTGNSFDNVTNFDFATLKYTKTGEPIWASRYDGAINGIDKAVSVVNDASGNVYVTGFSAGAGTGFDIATIKYNSSGTQLWVMRYNGPGNGDDVPSKIGIDNSGNVYVTGSSAGSGTGNDYVTIKYNSSGTFQWAARYNGSGNSDDAAAALIIDQSGNAYVTGQASGSGSSIDIVTVKYNGSGSQQWASVYNGASNDSDDAFSIVLDISGNVYVGGKSKSALTGFDLVVVKYDPAGIRQWTDLYNGSLNGNDEVRSLFADADNNIIAAGTADHFSTGSDYITIKYAPDGSRLWQRSYNGLGNADDIVSSACLDRAGNIYLAGYSHDLNKNFVYNTIKYNKDGMFKGSINYNYIDNENDRPSMVAVDTSGNVYVTGLSKSVESQLDYLTIKYKQPMMLELKTLSEGYYDELKSSGKPDTLKVYLRIQTTPYAVVDSAIAMTDSNGHSSVIFNDVSNGTGYFITISSKKNLETWSSAPVMFSSNTLYYNFTSGASQAYGNNLKFKGGKYCIYTGDIVKDGVINLADITLISNDAAAFTSGYNISDLNGDSIVNLTDLLFAYNNSTGFVRVRKPF